ncbi:MAG: hypothetical protein GY941_19750 [Planctomycetes bacterium]|nr:hypothetical protein [Planctomycetota bacterium]
MSTIKDKVKAEIQQSPAADLAYFKGFVVGVEHSQDTILNSATPAEAITRLSYPKTTATQNYNDYEFREITEYYRGKRDAYQKAQNHCERSVFLSIALLELEIILNPLQKMVQDLELQVANNTGLKHCN